MLLNILNIFSEPAYFGFLQFTYSDNVTRNADDAEENDRLSSVSHCDLSAVFVKPKINGVFNSSFGENSRTVDINIRLITK
jgi:hypothetical protein